jgi:hypothetical protein
MVLRCTTPAAFLAQRVASDSLKNSPSHCRTMVESESMEPQGALKPALDVVANSDQCGAGKYLLAKAHA